MKRLVSSLYVQVLVGVVVGGFLGWWQPQLGVSLRPLGEGFVALVKMLIGPIIFTTVVSGLAGMGDLKKVGKVGARALIYFEVVTTFALIIGIVVANVVKPGAGFHATPSPTDAAAIAKYTTAAKEMGVVDYLLHIIPKTFFSAFSDGDILQILLLALLFGFALGRLGERGAPVANFIHEVARVFFGIVSIVTRVAPLAAAGAMAYTIGQYGVAKLAQLGLLLASVYLTCAVFIVIVLGTIAAIGGFNVFKVIAYIRDELMLVLGTSSSESGLPGLMDKLEKAGCDRGLVGIVVPAGYSFNLDGTCIYLTLASIFLAQATDTPLSLAQQLGLIVILLITSKGAAGVTGSGFIVLAMTLESSHKIPVAAMALILGIDRFMSEARAITNFIGNAVGTLVIARWSGDFDASKGNAVLRRGHV